MARISKGGLSKVTKNRNSVHDQVAATYTIFTSNGEKYFQIDTYGKEDRVHKDKISQSIQIDKSTAEFLLDILKKEFNL